MFQRVMGISKVQLFPQNIKSAIPMKPTELRDIHYLAIF